MSQDAVGSLGTGAAISLKRLASFLCSAGTFLCMDIQLETPCDSLHSKCRLSHARIRPGSNSGCAFLKSQGQHWHVFIGTVHNMLKSPTGKSQEEGCVSVKVHRKLWGQPLQTDTPQTDRPQGKLQTSTPAITYRTKQEKKRTSFQFKNKTPLQQ